MLESRKDEILQKLTTDTTGPDDQNVRLLDLGEGVLTETLNCATPTIIV